MSCNCYKETCYEHDLETTRTDGRCPVRISEEDLSDRISALELALEEMKQQVTPKPEKEEEREPRPRRAPPQRDNSWP